MTKTMTVNKKKKKKKGNHTDMRCPYCGATVKCVPAAQVYENALTPDQYMFVCTRFPECDAYVKCQKDTKIPLGSLANGKLRHLRIEAHKSFNRLFMSGIMDENTAYQWLATVTQLPLREAHIAKFGEYNCNLVIAEAERYIKNNSNKKGGVRYDGYTEKAC